MAVVDRVHPLVDGFDDDEVVARSDREVVALTPLRADLLLAANRARRTVRLVTPATSRLTDPMRDALVSARGRWLVEDATGRWNGLTGVAADGDGIAAGFLQAQELDAVQLIVSASLRHRAERGTRIGPAVEAVAALAGAVPRGWGPHEPVEHAWDPRALTAHLAARAPEEARVVVVGDGLVGGTLTRRTDRGVEEVVQALVLAGPVGSAAETVIDAVPRRLTALADAALPLIALVLGRPGRPDLTTAPFLAAPPSPVALLIGAPGVRDLGLDARDLGDRFGALTVGRPRIPGVVVPFTGPGGGWAGFERFADHVGRDRIRAMTGVRPPEGGR